MLSQKCCHKRTVRSSVGSTILFVSAVLGSLANAHADDVSKTVNAHLSAGEFGLASQTVEAISNSQQRLELNSHVFAALQDAGEWRAAQASRRRVSQASTSSAEENTNSQQSLEGGEADFSSLMDLIRQGTADIALWSDAGDDGGSMTSFDNGVRVDPNGLLGRITQVEHSGYLRDLGVNARVADLSTNMAAPSQLRLVSLKRLEAAVAKQLADGKPVLQTMKHLAGLSRIEYVFVYPEEQDIVIGGPAEGWRFNEQGSPVGVQSGRPTLQLDDFVTVMRTFSSTGDGMFRCSIVPRQEALVKIREFAQQSANSGALNKRSIKRWVQTLESTLGLQDVQVQGVPSDSRVARVIVEADYRMKLIGIDKLDAGPEIPSFFDLLPTTLQKNPPAANALRWWMTMKYDAVLHSPDRNVFQVQGSSVLCQSENQFISEEGKQVGTGKAEETNQMFAKNFTDHYADLAERDLVFAELQNVFDLSLVAALIQREQLTEMAGWSEGVFAENGTYQPARYDGIKTVHTVANHRVYSGRDIIAQVAGGVQGNLMKVVTDPSVYRESDRLVNVQNRGRAPQLPEGRWWWDAAPAVR